MRAVVVKHEKPFRLVLMDVDAPVAGRDEALIDVACIALNPGELRSLPGNPDGARIGWDFAGVVAEPAGSAEGPQKGARVVGSATGYAWAERIAVPIDRIAAVPADVTLDDAVCLPVPAATAFFALRKGGFSYQKRLLVTGAAGAVGQYAVQIGLQAGYVVSAAVRRESQVRLVSCHGIHDVRVGDGVKAFSNGGEQFDLVVDVIGPEVATDVAQILSPFGRYVVIGADNGEHPLALPVWPMLAKNAVAHVINLFSEAAGGEETLSVVLSRMLEGLASGYLTAPLGQVHSWTEIDEVARRYLLDSNRSKPVLRLSGGDD